MPRKSTPRMVDIHTSVMPALWLLGARKAVMPLEMASTPVSAVVPLLRQQYAWVVVDTGSSFSELNLSVFDQSDLILTVLTPDVAALKVTQSTLDVFSALGIVGEKQLLLLNQTMPKVHLQQEQVEQALNGPVLAVLAMERDVTRRNACSGKDFDHRLFGRIEDERVVVAR